MTVDTQQSLIAKIYDTLTADTTLKAVCGGTVRLYPVWAPPDAAFPYLVQRADIRAIDDFFPMRRGTLIIDLWSSSPSASEILSIRKRIIEILDELDFSVTEISHCRISLETDGFIPESDEDIWHYSLQFGLRFYRKTEVAAIIGRT